VTAVKVLIVDDSMTVRAVLRRIVARTDGLTCVGEAADGAEAVKLAIELEPDAILMDLDLPVKNGYRATAEIMARRPTPIVVVTSTGDREQMMIAFRAIKQGVVGIFAKPEVPSGWNELARALTETLLHLGTDQGPVAAGPRIAPRRDTRGQRSVRYVGIGASTGGPGALCELLRQLGGAPGAGIAVVQHISPGFDGGLADWLAQELELDVRLARNGEALAPGKVRIAPTGCHLHLDGEGILRLDGETGPVGGHRPAVNELFRSLLASDAREVAAVLLSGMGVDGVDGLVELHRRGALTVVQEGSSCAVFGMPRAALERGAVDHAMSPAEIGRLLRDTMRGEE
jgi:two-component system chemotaxis response regulator CheB